jgi:4-hydroxy-tetrahydrodipicolinate synthase
MTFKYTGIYTALITPFKNGEIDRDAFARLIDMQLSAKVTGIITTGSTGEAATLSFDEKMSLISLAKESAGGRIQIIAGTGGNNTKEVILQSKKAQELGADGLIIVTPYYNRPSQEGLYQHYKAINDAVDIPIMLYTVPKRTGIDFSDDTIIRLSKLNNIKSLKDSSDDFKRPIRLADKVGEDFCFLTGDDENFVTYSANGGVGCVSVASNIMPDKIVALSEYITSGKMTEALKMQDDLRSFYELLFCETNPTPIKYAASLLNLCYPEVRLPLVVPEEESKNKIKAALKIVDLLQ